MGAALQVGRAAGRPRVQERLPRGGGPRGRGQARPHAANALSSQRVHGPVPVHRGHVQHAPLPGGEPRHLHLGNVPLPLRSHVRRRRPRLRAHHRLHRHRVQPRHPVLAGAVLLLLPRPGRPSRQAGEGRRVRRDAVVRPVRSRPHGPLRRVHGLPLQRPLLHRPLHLRRDRVRHPRRLQHHSRPQRVPARVGRQRLPLRLRPGVARVLQPAHVLQQSQDEDGHHHRRGPHDPRPRHPHHQRLVQRPERPEPHGPHRCLLEDLARGRPHDHRPPRPLRLHVLPNLPQVVHRLVRARRGAARQPGGHDDRHGAQPRHDQGPPVREPGPRSNRAPPPRCGLRARHPLREAVRGALPAPGSGQPRRPRHPQAVPRRQDLGSFPRGRLSARRGRPGPHRPRRLPQRRGVRQPRAAPRLRGGRRAGPARGCQRRRERAGRRPRRTRVPLRRRDGPPGHRDDRVRAQHDQPHSVVPAPVGAVPGALSALRGVLGPRPARHHRDGAVPRHRGRVRHLGRRHHRHPLHDGRAGVLPARVAAPLGGVQHQVLPRRGREVPAPQLRHHHRGGDGVRLTGRRRVRCLCGASAAVVLVSDCVCSCCAETTTSPSSGRGRGCAHISYISRGTAPRVTHHASRRLLLRVFCRGQEPVPEEVHDCLAEELPVLHEPRHRLGEGLGLLLRGELDVQAAPNAHQAHPPGRAGV
mmetsp:Transcript_16101/g.60949  ORF Transcript_16101/g.60949 Transcript_16101/m.60949 type:complete len:696 (+) Transcript_16101:1219-3306(+)